MSLYRLDAFMRTSLEARYEILPSLPSTGPMHEQFSATGMGMHSEGFVVRLHPSTGESWGGNLQGGLGGCEGVFHEPGSDQLIVVSFLEVDVEIQRTYPQHPQHPRPLYWFIRGHGHPRQCSAMSAPKHV